MDWKNVPLSDHRREIADEAPTANGFTDYDRTYFAVYLCLLHAVGEGRSEEEMCRVVLGIDPAREPERAQRSLRSHLGRARWMSEAGYRHLLR